MTPDVAANDEFAHAGEGDRHADRRGQPDATRARSEVPADALDKEKAIYRAQMENSGKPANVIEKIVEGKLGSFYAQVVLHRPAVDPRSEDVGGRRDRRGEQVARREDRGHAVRAPESRRSTRPDATAPPSQVGSRMAIVPRD